MEWKIRLARIARAVETLLDRVRPRRRDRAAVIDPYIGYSTPEALIARGRVLERLRRPQPRPGQSRLRNTWQLAARFFTRELAGVTLRAEDGTTAIADAEGYFTLQLPRQGRSGWARISVAVQGQPESTVSLPVQITAPEAEFGIISDIDDTLMQTGAYSLALNLWTTFTGNSLTRVVFEDAVALLDRLQDGRNPVFFVSSSPWNLHHFLEQVFDRAGLVRGPLFLRDLGIGRDKFIASPHGRHKAAAIDTIFAANPGLPFVLIGDTGQQDAEVYLAAARRHPGRVRRIILRAPGPGADERDKRFAERAAAMGIDLSIGRDYRHLIRIQPGEAAQPDRAAT